MTTNFNNWRFNPFTGTEHSSLISSEPHTIEYQDEWNAYGIQLDEGVRLDSPSSVSIIDADSLASFTEVPRSVAPSVGEYRVDYDASTYYGTSRIQFNAADTGKNVEVTYYGTGTVVKNNYRRTQLTTIPTNTIIEEDLIVDGGIFASPGIDKINLYDKEMDAEPFVTKNDFTSYTTADSYNKKRLKLLNDSGDVCTVAGNENYTYLGSGSFEGGVDSFTDIYCNYQYPIGKVSFQLKRFGSDLQWNNFADTPYIQIVIEEYDSVDTLTGTTYLTDEIYISDLPTVQNEFWEISKWPVLNATTNKIRIRIGFDCPNLGTSPYIEISRFRIGNWPGTPINLLNTWPNVDPGGSKFFYEPSPYAPGRAQLGRTIFKWLETEIALGAITTTANYELTTSKLGKDTVALIIQVSIDGANALFQYKGNSGTTAMFGDEIVARSNISDTRFTITQIIPVSYYNTNGFPSLRLAEETALGGEVLVNVRGAIINL